MSELTVNLKYRHPLSTTLSLLARVSFPIWALLMPLVAVGSLCALLVALAGSSFFGLPLTMAFEILMASIAISAIGMRLNKLVEKRHLLVEKSGIELPSALGTAFGSVYIPWQAIDKVEADMQDPSRPVLNFHITSGGIKKVECSRLDSREIEQLLLAVQLWASPAAQGASIVELQDAIKPHSLLEDKQNLGPSYTALWEDELHRRFRQVSFLPLDPGVIIRNGTLKVVRQLAMGGLSAIYLCQADQRDLVVVKESVIPPDAAPAMREKAEELFDREAKILMKLSHPKIVRVLDYFVTNERNYMMLEYVKGQDLRLYVKQNGPVRSATALSWALEIASVLEYLHTRDIPVIHRDLTPDNIVVKDDGSIVVIDFGAANEFIGNSTGTFVGKQCYISPEQFRGKAVPQSDIYALGCTLHYLLTGSDPQALSVAHPHSLNEIIPPEVDSLVADCTAIQLEQRIPDALILSQRIEALIKNKTSDSSLTKSLGSPKDSFS
jgi:tRNA A-37 threonylcarbamoyl transferase component Bud32